MSDILAQSLRLPCGVVLENRLVKAAMTEGLANPAGVPTAALERLYGLWSDGGAGLLLSGNILVDGDHLERPGNVIIDQQPNAEHAPSTFELGQNSDPQRQSFLGTNQPCRATDPKGHQPTSKGSVCGKDGAARWAIRRARCTHGC